jgi:hypothetical protein
VVQHRIWVLGESRLSFPDGGELDGNGDGSHLLGKTIRLDSHDFQPVDFVDDDATFDDNDRSQLLAGAQTIDGVDYADGRRIEAEYRLTLSDPDSGATWEAVAFNVREPGNSGTAASTSEGLVFIGPRGAFPPIGVDLVVIGTSEGPQDVAVADYASPLCFAAGTGIATPGGQVAVERLGPGDRVLLADGGTACVRLCLTRTLDGAALARDPRLRPVRITAGALGPGLPARDLFVSRQHRMLVASPIVKRMFGTEEVLIAAHRLTALPGIVLEPPRASVTYVHLVLDGHRVILAEGAPSESFLAGPVALRSLPPALAAEMQLILPDTCRDVARVIPSNRGQVRCVARHLKSRTSILAGGRAAHPSRPDGLRHGRHAG